MLKTGCITLVIAAIITMAVYVFQRPSQPARPAGESVATSETRKDIDPNPPGKPFQMDNGWSPYMESPIKAKLRDPDSFKFDFGTPFELQRIQDVEYWMSAIRYRAKNGFGGYNRDLGMILEKDGQWQFYTSDETSNMRLKKGDTPTITPAPQKHQKHTN